MLSTAKGLNINLLEVAEIDIIQAVNKLKAQQWKIENRTAMQSSNNFIEENGLLLHSDRLF